MTDTPVMIFEIHSREYFNDNKYRRLSGIGKYIWAKYANFCLPINNRIKI